ncbi:hypothetical protein ACEWY4_012396 [Coilia grayii]|uniref:C2 domain-containing protein n=1 Tax=Coilia grayii TaxID=363190 RepID=A0ABD1K0Z3_9TELE
MIMMKALVQKAQECAEQILGKDVPISSTCKQPLHGNILTPHNIPEFFLPPRLVRHHPPAVPCTLTHKETHNPMKIQGPARLCGDMKVPALTEDNRWLGRQPSQTQTPTQQQTAMRPTHLAVESLDQAYLYESPHTRRKESLFHCAVSQLKLEQHTPTAAAAPSQSHTRRTPGRVYPRACLALNGKTPLSQTTVRESGAETDSPSSTESTPQATPPARRWSPSPSYLAPPLPFPLELLHCQERLHREHLLLLPTRGRLRLATERPVPSPSHDQPPILRVRVVSVEGVRDSGAGSDLRPFSCSLSLCLTPGKLQPQHSATIRHCREPIVFNEDFYFSQPEGQALSHMQLQIKVKDKSGGLGRVCVLGVISKPLSELMAL